MCSITTSDCNIREAKLNFHDVVKFDARVSLYVKGYKGYRNYDLRFDRPLRIDYRLSYPTQVVNLGSDAYNVNERNDSIADTTDRQCIVSEI